MKQLEQKEGEIEDWKMWLGIIIIAGIFIFAGFIIGRSTKDETPEIISPTTEVICKNFKTVYILEEAKNCREFGGQLRVNFFDVLFVQNGMEDKEFDSLKKLTCTKNYTEENREIKETLFEYNF